MTFDERGHPPKHNDFPSYYAGPAFNKCRTVIWNSWISDGALSHVQESECLARKAAVGFLTAAF